MRASSEEFELSTWSQRATEGLVFVQRASLRVFVCALFSKTRTYVIVVWYKGQRITAPKDVIIKSPDLNHPSLSKVSYCRHLEKGFFPKLVRQLPSWFLYRKTGRIRKSRGASFGLPEEKCINNEMKAKATCQTRPKRESPPVPWLRRIRSAGLSLQLIRLVTLRSEKWKLLGNFTGLSGKHGHTKAAVVFVSIFLKQSHSLPF